MNILIFGGTTEGRVLSKKLAEKKKTEDSITVCVASDYGEKMMNNIPVNIHVGRLDKDQMIQFIEDGNYGSIKAKELGKKLRRILKLPVKNVTGDISD